MSDDPAGPRAPASDAPDAPTLRRMVATVPAILFSLRPDLACDRVEGRVHDFLGVGTGALLDHAWRAYLHEEDVAEAAVLWREAAREGRSFEAEMRFRHADGTHRWFRVRAEAERGGAGEVLRWYGSATDVHDRHVAEARQGVLHAELQHRVRNMLAVVRSIITHTSETSPDLRTFAAHLSGRLAAIARAETAAARMPGQPVELEDLVRDELLAAAADGEQLAEIAGPPVPLHGKMVGSLGLALHELATNAVKYGALSETGGRLAARWTLENEADGRWVRLEWWESGVTVADDPAEAGFGWKLILHGLPYDLGARTSLDLGENGLHCRIAVRLGAAGPETWHAAQPDARG